MTRQQWLVFVPMTLATAGLTACASMLGGQQLQDLKVRPVETTQTQAASQRDALYESAVAAINDRDYGRALDYLQAEKAKDPRNVKALNALGVVYDKLGRFDLSARYYAQAKAIEPDSKIVAENMGYSKVLQHIIDPAAPVAVATVDLPPNIATPSLPAAPASPVAPMPAAKIADAAPAIPVAITQSPVATAKPSTALAETGMAPAPKPEAKRVSAPPVAYAFASQPSLASASTPSLPAMPAALAANSQPSSTPAVLAAPATSVVAQPEFAAPVPPETVMPAAIPAGRLALAQAPHAAGAARSMSFPDSAPAPSSSNAVAIASAAQPVAPVVPIIRPPERKVAAPALYPIAPSRFKSEEISVLTMTQMEAPVPERKPATPAAIPAVPPLASQRAVANSNAPVVVRPPAPKADVAFSAPAREKRPLVVASLAVPPAMHPVMDKSVRPASNAPAPIKPVAISKPTVAPVATPAKAAAVPSAKPAPFAMKTATVNAASVKTASAKPMVKAEPMKMATAKPAAPSALAANRQVAGKKFLTIGQPVRLTNASGKANGSGPVLRRLTVLGWTMRAADGRAEPRTVLYYAKSTVAAAKALQRTLPFPVRLVVDKANASGMRLVIGRDYLSWKPRNTTMATLWQKGATTSPWQRASMKGAR